jgi:hypothetical protein
MRIGRTAVTEDAQVDDMPDARVSRGVGDRLGLVGHRDRVARHDEQAVDPLQRRGEGPGVVAVELHRGPPSLRHCSTVAGSRETRTTSSRSEASSSSAAIAAPVRPVDPSTSTRGFVLSISGSFRRKGEAALLRARQRDRSKDWSRSLSSLDSDLTSLITQTRERALLDRRCL